MTFVSTVEAEGSPLSGRCENGLRALDPGHARAVRKKRGRWTGSVAIDAALRASHPQDSRWDYGVGYRDPSGREHAIWVEFHSASTRNVREVIAKLRWLRAFLREHIPRVLAMTSAPHGGSPYVWLTMGPVRIVAGSSQERALRNAGLDLPRRVLQLP